MAERTINEIEIWTDVINPDGRDMSAPEASALLRWKFNDRANCQMPQDHDPRPFHLDHIRPQ